MVRELLQRKRSRSRRRGLAHFSAEKMLFHFRRKLCLTPLKQTGALILRERLRENKLAGGIFAQQLIYLNEKLRKLMVDDPNSMEKTGLKILMAALVIVTTIAVYLAIDVVLLGFLGILFAVFLVKVSVLLGQLLPLGYRWNLLIVIALLLAVSIGGSIMFAQTVESRLDVAKDRVEESSSKLKQWLDEHPIAMSTIESIPFVGTFAEDRLSLDDEIASPESDDGESDDTKSDDTKSDDKNSDNENSDDSQSENAETNPGSSSKEKNAENSGKQTDASSASNLAGRVFQVTGGLLKTTFGLLTNSAVIFWVGVFLAFNPALYRDGFARLFPINQRRRVVEVMDKMGDAAFNWLKGRSISMLVTGIGTGVALALLGVPLAITVGVVTALLTFIPNIGGIIALALAMLLALSQGPATVIWVVVIYTGLQLVESNILTPIVQQQQTSIPPALLLIFQLFMGVLVGFLGVLVATPLLAVTLVLINEAWVKDTLGDLGSNEDNVAGLPSSGSS